MGIALTMIFCTAALVWYLERKFDQIEAKENKVLSELTDLQTAVSGAVTEIGSIASELQSLEGTTPAPGVLEGLANQLNAAVAAAQAAVNPPASGSSSAPASGSGSSAPAAGTGSGS